MKVNETILDATTKQLKALEDKYGILNRMDATIKYNGRYTRALAGVKSYHANRKKQELFLGNDYSKDPAELIGTIRESIDIGWHMPALNDEATLLKYTVTHEYGHMIHNYLWSEYKGLTSRESFISHAKDDIIDIAIKNNLDDLIKKQPAVVAEYLKENIDQAAKNPHIRNEVIKSISQYGKSNCYEFFAEAFANSQLGKPNIIGEAMIEYLQKVGL